ncbi:putative membrane protein [Propionispora sp. 2/2-37]|uniref:amino acid permease n=1 Tax=Propionispora sp. 2/2-37 TaxID=1677858 RepID=UPI0006BB5CF5|nr:amino acid permease [Propionispora sp. 2/2-37]CUH96596.1 putative membrane protein [Propionispora sp. 2/2-37]
MSRVNNHDPSETKLRTDLGLISALSLVVGMVLGAGAFMKPPAVLAAAGDFNWALAAWGIGGLFSISGGLTLCELGVMFPRTGGIYVYLEEIYGPKVAFLYGWMTSVIFGPAMVGTLTGYFSSVFCLLFTIPDYYTSVVGAGVLGFIAFINSVGVKQAGYLQTVATFCKLVPIALIAVFGIWKGNGQVPLFTASDGALETTAPFAVAILATLFAYDGWAQVASVAGEIKNPGKVLPKAIIGGILFLVLTYLAINVAIFKMFAAGEMVALGHDASSIAAQRMFGLMGGNLIAVGIMISILGGLNGYVMTLSRTIYIMGQRRQILGASFLRKVDNDSGSPVNALLVLVVSAFVYSRLLDADRLSDIAMFSVWLFYLLTFIAVIVARMTHPDLPRPYRVSFYPVVPLIAIGGALYVIYGMLSYQFFNGIASIALTLAGLPLYYYLNRTENKSNLFARWKTKYIVGLGALLVMGLLTLFAQVVDHREEIKVGIVPQFAPFAYEDGTGRLTGFDIELMNTIAQKAGLKISYQMVSLEYIFDALNHEYVDIAICSLSDTPERQKRVHFTQPYIEKGGLALLTRQGAAVREMKDLSGIKVGVPQGSTAEDFTRSSRLSSVQAFQSNPDMIQAFNQGWIDAIVFDKLILEYFVSQKMITQPTMLKLIQPENYAIAYANKHKELGERLKRILSDMKANGELEALYQKWFSHGDNILS